MAGWDGTAVATGAAAAAAAVAAAAGRGCDEVGGGVGGTDDTRVCRQDTVCGGWRDGRIDGGGRRRKLSFSDG